MLSTQVNHWANLETKRHNLAMEKLTGEEMRIKAHQAESQRISALSSHTSSQASLSSAYASNLQAQAAGLNAQASYMNVMSQNALRDEQMLTEQSKREQIKWSNLETLADTQKAQAQTAYYGAQTTSINERLPYETKKLHSEAFKNIFGTMWQGVNTLNSVGQSWIGNITQLGGFK